MSSLNEREPLPPNFKALLTRPELIDHELARRSFAHYRRVMRPTMLRGWFTDRLATELQSFYDALVAGERPVLGLFTPPQHGKSWAVTDFIAWLAGKNPDLRTIFTSFSGRLGIRTNLALQRAYTGNVYPHIFPDTLINSSNVVTLANQYLRNREVLEYVGRDGYFRNTTVQGPITGESLDVGVIDDPIKGSKEARSKAAREGAWDWFTEDFFPRFSDHAGMLLICTRWHVDDPAGRMMEAFPNMRVLRFPAFAEQDEQHRKEGEPLFPELKPAEFLEARRSVMPGARFQAVYQQSPTVDGGGLIKVGLIGVIEAMPAHVKKRVRYWDKASVAGGGDYTVGALVAHLMDGRFVIEDIQRGQWSSGERERRIKNTADRDGREVDIWLEQEPGSGGKESAEASIRNLAGYVARADKVTGNKEARADPFAAQVEAGNVVMLKAAWNKAMLDEMETFPGAHDDQVDAVAGAFAKLAAVGKRAAVW